MATTDVIIVGAGLSGATAAHGLSRQGIRVTLVDPRPEYPHCFKAEKIEADQANLFRELGLMDALLPHCGTIRQVLNSRRGRVMTVTYLEQYGILYHDMVNAVRRSLNPTVDFRIARVEGVSTGDDHQRVELSTGEELSARLLIVASGTGGDLAKRLGLQREIVRKEHSAAFGFDIERTNGKPFPFESVTYYPDVFGQGVGYLTLFLIRQTMRANLFTFQSLTEEWPRAFLRQPLDTLQPSMPGLSKLIGDFRIASRIEAARIDLYRCSGEARPGFITTADVGQSVCPSTGTGLSKTLTDTSVLCKKVPMWLSTPGMGVEKTREWYEDPQKQSVDRHSLSSAEYQRRLAVDNSLRWRWHRARLYLESRFAGGAEARMFTKKLTA